MAGGLLPHHENCEGSPPLGPSRGTAGPEQASKPGNRKPPQARPAGGGGPIPPGIWGISHYHPSDNVIFRKNPQSDCENYVAEGRALPTVPQTLHAPTHGGRGGACSRTSDPCPATGAGVPQRPHSCPESGTVQDLQHRGSVTGTVPGAGTGTARASRRNSMHRCA